MDTCISSINTLYQKAEADTLHSEIDLLLKEKAPGWMTQIVTLMLNGEHREAKETDDGLIALKKVCLMRGDDREKASLLGKVSSVEELREVYQKTVFCLRRMELDMPDEDCEVFLALMEQWELPAAYMIMVLSQGDIYDRRKAGNRLILLLHKNGYQDAAEEIMMWVKANEG